MSVQFIVAKGNQEDLKWVSKAVSTDVSRTYMGHIWYDREEGVLVATNAHRMHLLDLNDEKEPRVILAKALMESTPCSTFLDYKQGIITVYTEKECVDLHIHGGFPNYKRVIPDLDTMENDNDTMWDFSTKKDKKGTRIIDQTIGLLIAKHQVPLNPSDLYDMAQGKYYFSKAVKGPTTHGITLEDNTGRKAIIMPLVQPQ